MVIVAELVAYTFITVARGSDKSPERRVCFNSTSFPEIHARARGGPSADKIERTTDLAGDCAPFRKTAQEQPSDGPIMGKIRLEGSAEIKEEPVVWAYDIALTNEAARTNPVINFFSRNMRSWPPSEEETICETLAKNCRKCCASHLSKAKPGSVDPPDKDSRLPERSRTSYDTFVLSRSPSSAWALAAHPLSSHA